MAEALLNNDRHGDATVEAGGSVNPSRSRAKSDSVEALLAEILKGQKETRSTIESLNSRINDLEEGNQNYEYSEGTGSVNNFDHDDDQDVQMTDQGESTAAYSQGEPSKRPSEEGSLFSAYSKRFKSVEEVAPPIDAKLAELADHVFTKGLSEDRMKELKDLIKRPENCQYLKNPKVDVPIWSKLNKDAQVRACNCKLYNNLLPKQVVAWLVY